MVMYRIYNSDILEKLITTVHKIHDTTTWNENLLYLRMIREKYVKMYKKNFRAIMTVCQSNKNSFEELSTHFSSATIKITRNFR